jgi:hypothetical protein
MSDNLDIRARLSADDKMSPTIQKLLSQLDRLQAKLGRGFGKDSIGAKILSDDDLKRLNLWDKRFDGFTKTHLDWARRVRDANGLTAASWGNVTNQINDQVKAYDKANKSQKEGIRKEIERLYKRAQALKSIANQDARDRGDMESRAQDNISQIQATAFRNEQRRHQQHHSQLLSARRQFFAGLSKLAQTASSVGRTAGLTGLAAVGATAAMGRSSIRSGVEVDRAETFARMNMDQSKLNGRTMRNDWALPTAVRMGVDPATLFQQGVEAAKAGVPEQMAQQAAELSIMTAKRFGIDASEMMTAIGRSVAQEIGSGRMKGDDITGLRRKFNIASALAAETATDPAETLSFLRSGLGAGASVGMSDVGSLAFGNASILAGGQARQSSRYLSHFGEQMSELELRRKTIQQSGGRRSPEDKLFMQVPNLLGYGSLTNIRKSLKDNPDEGFGNLIKSFGKIKDLEKRAQALHAFFGSEFGPIIKNMIDAPGLLDDSLRIAKKAAGENAQNDGIVKAWVEYQKGMENMLDRVSAIWKVFKAEIGDTLKPYINQLSQWAEDQYKAIGTSGLKDRLKAVIDGLLKGFTGKDGATLRDLLDKAFGKPGDINGGQVDSFFKFAFGFADGLRQVAKAVGDTFKAIASAFGTNTDDPEAMGRFAAKLVGLVVALNLLSPVIGVITTLAVGIGVLTSALKIAEGLGFFKLLGKIPGMALGKEALATGAKVATGVAAPWLPLLLMGDGREGNSAEDMKGLTDAHKAAREAKQKAKAKATGESKAQEDGLFHPSRYIGDSIKKLDGNIQRAAFMTYGDRAFNGFGGGGIQTAFSGGGGGRGGGGGLPALMRSTPGGALPNMGVGSSGSIIKRGGVPSGGSGLNRAAFERNFAGTPMAGMYDQVVAAAKARGISGSLLAGVMAQETGHGKHMLGNNPGGVMGPKGLMQFNSLGAGIERTADAVAKNWNAAGGNLAAMGQRYAPIGAANDPTGLNRSWVPNVQKLMGDMGEGGGGSESGAVPGDSSGLADKLGLRGKANFMNGQFGGPGENLKTIMTASGKKLTVNSAASESFKGFVDELESSGYKVNSLGGFNLRRKKGGGGGWSQHAYGNAIDINPGSNPQFGGTDMPANARDMAAKYGLSWGGDWSKRWRDPMHFEWNGSQPWKNVPSATDAVKNVPAAPPQGAPMGGPGGGRGDVAIHINGGQHDPEALATLVQRRVDESMNWRAHDSESEYT